MSKRGLVEANVACEFYHRARVRGFKPQMEVTFPSQHHRSGKMRIDCIVKTASGALWAVEFKRDGRKAPAMTTRQGRAYDALPFPVFFCLGFDGIDGILDAMEAIGKVKP